jgi:excisionase family DNA binding protein
MATHLDAARRERDLRAAFNDFDNAQRDLNIAQHRVSEAQRRILEISARNIAAPSRGDLLTRSEAAEHLGVSVVTLAGWVKRGEIKPADMPPGRGRRKVLRFDPLTLDAFIERRDMGRAS